MKLRYTVMAEAPSLALRVPRVLDEPNALELAELAVPDLTLVGPVLIRHAPRARAGLLADVVTTFGWTTPTKNCPSRGCAPLARSLVTALRTMSAVATKPAATVAVEVAEEP